MVASRDVLATETDYCLNSALSVVYFLTQRQPTLDIPMSAHYSIVWEPVPLPYFNNVTAVALPSTEEIRSCTDVLHERLSAKVVAVNDLIVAKFGGTIEAREGQTLIYLERYVPSVPAPRLYAMYYDSNQLFLVMQRVPGVPLEQLWPSLSDDDKNLLTAQLRRTFNTLRQAECPWQDFFGGLAGDGVYHHLLYCQKDSHRHLGPFRGEPAFVKGLTDNFRAYVERNGHPVFKVRFYEAHLCEVLRNHRPTLTHGDIHRKNIIVAENGDCSQSEGEGRFSIFLVDWEMAGWLPDFWEYFCASMTFNLLSRDDDWALYTSEFLPVWLAETATMRMFDKDMGG